jgi:hypothetical protein
LWRLTALPGIKSGGRSSEISLQKVLPPGRHSGESRNPAFFQSMLTQSGIPAFAGMTAEGEHEPQSDLT